MLSSGDKAPAFSLPASDGQTFSLASAKGKSVVVYFYPRDDTPGCTVESIEFSRARAAFEKAGASVIGISRDSIASHCRFRDKHGLTIALLSDPELAVHRAYGVWGEKTMYGKKVEGVIRSTFLIGPDGKLTRTWRGVKVAGHVDQVLAELKGEAAPSKPSAKRADAKAKTPAAKTPAAKKPAAKPRAR